MGDDNNITRNYNQYIELKVSWDEEHKAKEVWPVLYEHDVALKSWANNKFHFNNFTGNKFKTMWSVTSLLSDEPYLIQDWPSGTTALLNRVLGGSERWSKEKVTVPNTNVRDFDPDQFAIRERVLIGTELSNWYNTEDESIEFLHDLKYKPEGSSYAANIHAFTVQLQGQNYINGTWFIKGITFKLKVNSKDQSLFDGSESLINDLILGTIVTACQEVGPMTHSLSCKGEIEVEKAVSCNRFQVPESNDEEE
jgi:hypothetical protein